MMNDVSRQSLGEMLLNVRVRGGNGKGHVITVDEFKPARDKRKNARHPEG
jgi:hypothetical protein